MANLKKKANETSADYQARVAVEKKKKAWAIQQKLFKTKDVKERRTLATQLRKANAVADKAEVRAEKALNKEFKQRGW